MNKYMGILLFFISPIHAIGDGPREIAAQEEEYVNLMKESILKIERDLNSENSAEEIRNKRILYHILFQTLVSIKERQKRAELSAFNADDLAEQYNRVIAVVESQWSQSDS